MCVGSGYARLVRTHAGADLAQRGIHSLCMRACDTFRVPKEAEVVVLLFPTTPKKTGMSRQQDVMPLLMVQHDQSIAVKPGCRRVSLVL